MDEIEVNGVSRPLAPGATVADLLVELGVDPRMVAVERNLEIVPKAAHQHVTLVPGDRLEIVTFVGGG